MNIRFTYEKILPYVSGIALLRLKDFFRENLYVSSRPTWILVIAHVTNDNHTNNIDDFATKPTKEQNISPSFPLFPFTTLHFS